MNETIDTREKLQQRIREKKSQIRTFLSKIEPRSTFLTVASIVCSGLAALLTAGPAAGGPSLTQALTQALGTAPETAPSWRLLCAAATVLSFLGTTTLAIYKVQDLANKVAKSQAAKARLEALETYLAMTDISIHKATDQYSQVLQDVSFVPDADLDRLTAAWSGRAEVRG
jgi:hypothetical protein